MGGVAVAGRGRSEEGKTEAMRHERHDAFVENTHGSHGSMANAHIISSEQEF
jgi:hypothetical protein